MRLIPIASFIAALSLPAASAAETVTYRYDARGRLTQVAHTAGVNAGVTTTYAFDDADNRTAVTTSGAPFDEQARRGVVVPLLGLSLIPSERR